jgi:hypothetical protein
VSENQPSLQAFSAPPRSVQIPSWKTAYEKTLWELDAEKLLTLIHAAEGALFDRWQDLGDEPGYTRERVVMKIAADDLLAIKINRLGWPDPCRLWPPTRRSTIDSNYSTEEAHRSSIETVPSATNFIGTETQTRRASCRSSNKINRGDYDGRQSTVSFNDNRLR